MLLVPETGLLFWMLLSFGIVFFILARFGFPIITKMVENRREYIEQSLQNAKAANEQLANVQTETSRLLTTAEQEQARILSEAIAMRNRIVAEAKSAAQEAGRKQLEIVREQIEVEKQEAIRTIRHQVALLSVGVAEKILRMNLADDKSQMDMIDRILDEIVETSANEKNR